MIKVTDLSVAHHGAKTPTLSGINLDIAPGEFALICGPTGSGKSTMLLSLNGIMQHESSAVVSGEVLLGNRNLTELPLQQICKTVGTVFQNPDSQLSAATPEQEIAFGLENLGIPRQVMRERIDKALQCTGLENERHKKVQTLSGGQKQRLVIACALALEPKVLLLDEPLSQLDPKGAGDILAVLAELKTAQNISIVMVEHRLEGPFKTADCILVMDKGKIVQNAAPDQILKDPSGLRRLGLQTPPLSDLFERLGFKERPLRSDEAPNLIPKRTIEGQPKHPREEMVLEVDTLGISYRQTGERALDNVSFTVHKGDRIGILGTNGSGKSTLLNLLAGVIKPSNGCIKWTSGPPASVGLVMQNPDVMLIRDTVEDELRFAPCEAGKDARESTMAVSAVMEQLCLTPLKERPPFALSRGERQRTAVGSVLTQKTSILLLDEPTTGQDRARIEDMMTVLMNDFDAVLFSTHDVETAARHANRIILLCQGRLVAEGPVREVLFDLEKLEAAAICPTELQRFAARQSLRLLDVESMVEVFA